MHMRATRSEAEQQQDFSNSPLRGTSFPFRCIYRGNVRNAQNDQMKRDILQEIEIALFQL